MQLIPPSDFNHNQIFQLELHSVLNVLNVINAQIQLIQQITIRPRILDKSLRRIFALVEAIKSADSKEINAKALEDLKDSLWTSLDQLERRDPVLKDHPEYNDYLDTFTSVFDVLDLRIRELYQREQKPDRWKYIKIPDYIQEYDQFFKALVKNSRFRFGIVCHKEDQGEKDYLIRLNIDSDLKDGFYMPLLVKDIIRDLVANARKYTDPGGFITIDISYNNEWLEFSILDNGKGIPADELKKVANYGYRASNVRNKIRSMGNGIGLTKAAYVVNRFDGKFWIDSEEQTGTHIRFQIPVPESIGEAAYSSLNGKNNTRSTTLSSV